jgi:hypothetical protein
MRLTITTLLITVLTHVCFYVSLAQGTSPATTRIFKHKGKINSSYDPASNKTRIVLNPYRLPINPMYAETQDTFSIMCGFTVKGKKLTGRPEAIELHVISHGYRFWKFVKENERHLSLTIDGEQIDLGVMRIVGTNHYVIATEPVRTIYIEELYILLTYQGMIKIAAGKRVSLNVGQQKIELENEHLEALRDLASRMTP